MNIHPILHRIGRAFGFLVLCISCGLASAAEVSSYTVLSEQHDWVIHADASHEHRFSRVIRVDTESGVDVWGEWSVSHNADLGTLRVTHAHLIQPDGQRIDVPPENIKLRDAYVDEDAPIFSNEKEVFVIFPKVQVGSELHYGYEERVHTPNFPGQFSWYDYQLNWLPVHKAKISVAYDPALDMRFAVRGNYQETTGQGKAVPEGYATRHYGYAYTDVTDYESGGVAYSDTAPMLVVSNWADYAAVGLAYDRRAQPHAQPRPDITALAKKLTEGVTSERERVQRLHAWVAQNIRYVGTYVGAGGFVPNPAALVLERHYGDCKDHVALLEAMLTAVGIDSSPALINSGRAYRLLPLPSSAPFNHVITYIPSLDLFVDSTHRYARTGTLPLGVMGKPVVIARSGELKTTPKPSPEHDTETVVSDWVMQANGDMTATTGVSKTGWLEVSSRHYYSDQDEIDQASWARRYLANHQEVGSGESHAPDADDWSAPWRINAKTDLRGAVNLPEPSAFVVPVGVAPGTLRRLADHPHVAQRGRPWRCTSQRIREISSIQLPEGVEVHYLPKGVHIEEKQWRYESRYALKGKRLTVERELVLRFAQPWCSGELAKAWSEFMWRVRRDVRGQVFVGF
jgi:hypothetical protein